MKKPRHVGKDATRAQAKNTHPPVSAPPSAGQSIIDAHCVARTRAPLAFGPWSPGLDPIERVAQLRALAALVLVFLGLRHPLVETLRAAEADSDAAARALHMLDRLPTLRQRRLLSVFARVTWPPARRTRLLSPANPDGAP
jgi:hypothetical protein